MRSGLKPIARVRSIVSPSSPPIALGTARITARLSQRVPRPLFARAGDQVSVKRHRDSLPPVRAEVLRVSVVQFFSIAFLPAAAFTFGPCILINNLLMEWNDEW
jgi:hypothetical protein